MTGGTGPRERAEVRTEIRERLARGLYALERSRDRTPGSGRAAWEDLNQGRRATRLAHADELLSVLVGAFGFDWAMLEGIRASVAAARAAGEDPSAGDDALRAAVLLEALLPRPMRGDG